MEEYTNENNKKSTRQYTKKTTTKATQKENQNQKTAKSYRKEDTEQSYEMTQPTEKKNRFQISREVQEEFVNSVAESMLALAKTAGTWQKPWQSENPLEMPFCPTTGREYSGSNMVKLLLTSIVNEYDDNRWMTFKQLVEFQEEHSDLEMQISKGEKGVKLLRPEEITFIVDEDGKWQFLNSEKEIAKYEEEKLQGKHGEDAPEVQRMMLFYPFTVFNASQIENFPARETPLSPMGDIERNQFVEDFIASSGVTLHHHKGDAYYDKAEDVIKMPFQQTFNSTEEYYAAKLHEFYHATGHESRENRRNSQSENIKDYAFEELRAEMFSMLAGARFNLPMPESNSAAYINHWNQKFSDGDVKAVFKATSEASKILSLMHQFELGEQPRANWFPRQEDWQYLIELQEARDKESATEVATKSENVAAKSVSKFKNNPFPRPEAPSFEQSAKAFQEADNPITQARAILQNPELLEKALMSGDGDTARSLAQLCDSFSTALHMELDVRKQAESANAPRVRM